jgi:hypothetical protein
VHPALSLEKGDSKCSELFVEMMGYMFNKLSGIKWGSIRMDQRHKAFVHTLITRNRFEVPSRTSTFVFMHSEQPSNPPTLSSSPNETCKEERKFRRFPVALTSLFSADGPEWSGTAINLSREGCAIRSTTPVQKGDYLHLLIFPGANQTPIEVGVARVRWAANEQCGVEFITLAPRDATRLQDLLTIIGV